MQCFIDTCNKAINLRMSSRTHIEFGIQFPQKYCPICQQGMVISQLKWLMEQHEVDINDQWRESLLCKRWFLMIRKKVCHFRWQTSINTSGEMDHISKWPNTYQLFSRVMVNTITIRINCSKYLICFWVFGKGQLRKAANVSGASLRVSLSRITLRYSVYFRPRKHLGVLRTSNMFY